jgi:MFS family permease
MPSAPASSSPLELFRLRDYRLMLAMVVLTTIVQTGQGVAVGWEVYERTGSALALGWLGLAQFLPIGLFFLPAGQIADRFDRRRVVSVSLLIWARAGRARRSRGSTRHSR